jgi:hypothetical protein
VNFCIIFATHLFRLLFLVITYKCDLTCRLIASVVRLPSKIMRIKETEGKLAPQQNDGDEADKLKAKILKELELACGLFSKVRSRIL